MRNVRKRSSARLSRLTLADLGRSLDQTTTSLQKQTASSKRTKPKREDYASTLLKILSWTEKEGWSTEHKFHPKRRWRLDLANVVKRIAVEVEGEVVVLVTGEAGA